MELEGSYRIHKHPPYVLLLSQINPILASPSHVLKMHFNIILPSTPWHSKSFPSLGSPHVNPVSTLPVSHTCHMPRPSHSWLYHPLNIWWGVQTINLRFMLSSPVPSYLVPLRSSFLPLHPILEHPQPMFLCHWPSLYANKNYLLAFPALNAVSHDLLFSTLMYTTLTFTPSSAT